MEVNLGKVWSYNDPSESWQWVREMPVAILEENEMPAWGDADTVLTAVRAMGAKMLRYPAIGWGAHFFDKSNWLPKYNGMPAERDLYGEINNKMKENGIKMMAYCHFGVLYREYDEINPGWLSRKADMSPYIWNKIHRMICLCNEEAMAAMSGAIEEVIIKYQPDVVYLDGPGWYNSDCHCCNCKNLYKARYAEELPEEISEEDGSYIKYNAIRDEILAGVVVRVNAAVKKHGDIPLLINTTMHSRGSHRNGLPELAVACADGANTTEVHRPNTYWQMLESAKLAESLKKISICYCPPGPYETLRTFDNIETEVMGYTYAMESGTPMLEPVSSFFYDETGSAVMKKLTENLYKYKEIYYRTSPVKEFALVYPRHFGQKLDGQRLADMNKRFSGVFQALTHGHRHFDCMFDTQLSEERLQGYKAIYLPESNYLPEDSCNVLKNFIKNGGNVIFGPQCTLYDEMGHSKNSFGLADVMGVDFAGFTPEDVYLTREYRETGSFHGYSKVPEAYVKITSNELTGGSLKTGRLIPVSDAVVGIPALKRYVEYMIVKPHAGTKTLAELYLPSGGAFGSAREFPYGNPPVITVNKYGKGKAVYMSVYAGYNYLLRGLPEQRAIEVSLTDFCLEHKPLIRMDAPAGVVVNVVEDAGCIYIQLLNYCGPMFESSFAVSEIVPLSDIKIYIRDTGFISVNSLYGTNQAQIVNNKNGYTEINVNKMELHEIIVLRKADSI